MNIILGATGQVGSLVLEKLRRAGRPVTGVARNREKAAHLGDVLVRYADFMDPDALRKALQGGHTVFLLTPENPASEEPLSDTRLFMGYLREALIQPGIERIIGLSSMGAQHGTGTGNLLFSHMLEHAFIDLPVAQVFVRPAYYYSNWSVHMELAKEAGILPTFFPAAMKLPMIAPVDVAEFIAAIMMDEQRNEKVYEIMGPEIYSPRDVAGIIGGVIGREVDTLEIPPEEWKITLCKGGFSPGAADSLVMMTRAVIDGRACPEKKDRKIIRLTTTAGEYFRHLTR